MNASVKEVTSGIKTVTANQVAQTLDKVENLMNRGAIVNVHKVINFQSFTPHAIFSVIISPLLIHNRDLPRHLVYAGTDMLGIQLINYVF